MKAAGIAAYFYLIFKASRRRASKLRLQRVKRALRPARLSSFLVSASSAFANRRKSNN